MEKYYVPIKNASKYGIKESNAILNQVKLIDTRRLIETASPTKASIEFVDCVLDGYVSLIKKIVLPYRQEGLGDKLPKG